MALLALVTTGCDNQLNKANLGQTPSSMNANTPNYGETGGPLVPANYPNAGNTAPPALQRDFTLYSDTNITTLSAEARSIVQQAADAARQAPATHIVVTGHTDTVGTARYNQRLSERRAAAVREGLVAQGVPADEIVASGVGKSQLAVPTAQGVNEPRNRRIVITEGGPGM